MGLPALAAGAALSGGAAGAAGGAGAAASGAGASGAGALGGSMGAISVGLQVLGAGASIIQGIKAKRAQREAEARAERALNAAKRKIEVNRMEGLQVPLDAYDLNTQAILASQQQAVQGLRESGQRALQGGIQGSQMAAGQAFEGQRQQMAQDIYRRDQMIAQEQADIDRVLASISLQEAEGAQIAAAQREQMAAQAFSGAIKGLAGAGQTMYEASDLYGGGRKEELKAAMALQNATRDTENPLYQDMNARQARRAMLRSGQFNKEEIGNLATYGATYGKLNPFISFSTETAPLFTPYQFGSSLNTP
jgi:hypothetical protein